MWNHKLLDWGPIVHHSRSHPVKCEALSSLRIRTLHDIYCKGQVMVPRKTVRNRRSKLCATVSCFSNTQGHILSPISHTVICAHMKAFCSHIPNYNYLAPSKMCACLERFLKAVRELLFQVWPCPMPRNQAGPQVTCQSTYESKLITLQRKDQVPMPSMVYNEVFTMQPYFK